MNHLLNEKSPYLLQHVDNPVDWFPWCDEALNKAQQEQKLIFVSIGYSTCHWCHVMAHETFEDKLVAEKLNQNYVCIKVDREERPDIDTVFMHACQLLNGHGGWPLNLFLTPDTLPFYALTYAPRQSNGQQMGFIELVDKIIELWQQQPANLIANGKELTAEILKLERRHEFVEVEETLLHSAAQNFKTLYDHQHGGFGRAPKFPQPHNQSLLLRLAQRLNDSSLQHMALRTLESIDQGGITDQLGGGIHRYSVDEFWLVPHFEKMLYDQALISTAYIEAWQATNNPYFKQAAESVLNYTLRELRHPEGGFYCGEDADSEGAEGTYYLWSSKELDNILTAEENLLFSNYYNMTVEGNFEDKNILYRSSCVPQFPQRVQKIKEQLLKTRSQRLHPHLDDKILTGWNGLMIAPLARAGLLFQNSDYLLAAEKAAFFIHDKLMENGQLKRRYRDNETLINAFHEDYSFYIYGLIELFLANFNPDHLKQALALTEQCEQLFSDGKGGYFDSSEPFANGQGLGRTKHDGAIPAASSVTAHNLIRLARLTGKSHLEKRAFALFRSTLAHADQHPTSFAGLLQALDLLMSQQLTLVIVLPEAEKKLAETWLKKLTPLRHQLLTIITANPQKHANSVPFVAGKTTIDNKTTAWLCTETCCLPPTTDPSELEKTLQTHAPLNTFSK
ncbi:thioredoxin domain-containing protein [uncultured Desulfuromusa sp.]|uniref:thioredoxin domain-containing protein n=1 Tax=uncultured Desulfuromusa sp. TaxID=219183 RepID=UPI002AA6FD9D|nr:thioredoxin domain-containing protein [uncultured Desulfuromusa sp.]